MTTKEILQYCLDTLPGVVLVESWGETGIFYNPNGLRKRGVYVLTVKEKDGANDKASNLHRDGVFRVNIGVRKPTFQRLFGTVPTRPKAGGVVEMDVDFTVLDTTLPHPVYAWMGWIGILSPSKETVEQLKPLIQEAYEYACEKYHKRK